MKISGVWEYEKLEKQCNKMKHIIGFMEAQVEMIAALNFKLGEQLILEKEEVIQELRNEAVLIKAIKKHKEVEQQRYDRLQQARYELTKQRKENAELKAKIRRLEKMTGVRWGYNFDRGERWPVEGTINGIAGRIPLPLQEIVAVEE